MAKEFYTERDIEDMVKRGCMSLQVTENTVLTELAFEKALRLGLQLVREKPMDPPAAPVRPYISQVIKTNPAPVDSREIPSTPDDLGVRIKQAVNARLGTQIDPVLLEVIIQRVLKSTGVK